jgi:glycosyltransferase involved in cell wall biosynthesis
MGPGGAERVMARLVEFLTIRHEVYLITLESSGTSSFYELPQKAQLIKLDLLDANRCKRIWNFLVRVSVLRRNLRRISPDVVLSFRDTMNITALLAGLRLKLPIVISERVDPEFHHIGFLRSLLRRALYPLSECCVVQTSRVAMFFNSMPRVKVVVIPNPIILPSCVSRPAIANALGRYSIIAVGRLVHQKGFDRLIEAFAPIANRFSDWDLSIFGDGEARADLQNRIDSLGLSSRIRLPGITTEVDSALCDAHLFAFPSRFEGFPNALAEAMAAGLPAVGFAHVSGVEELVISERTGLLVHPFAGVSGLTAALERLMRDPVLRESLGAAAREHVLSWDPNHILAHWEQVLLSTMER